MECACFEPGQCKNYNKNWEKKWEEMWVLMFSTFKVGS